MTKTLYAHILLDRSQSMELCRDNTVSAVNEYVGGLNGDSDLDAAVSLSLFDTVHSGLALDLVIDGKSSKDWVPLTHETYVPRGSTPLYDATAATIARMKGEWHRPGETITLVIVTDGNENASKEHTKDSVKKLIEEVQKMGWLVMYLGANQDAFKVGAGIGLNFANTMDYDTKNIGATMRAASRSTVSYGLTGDIAAASFTSAERHAAKHGEGDGGAKIGGIDAWKAARTPKAKTSPLRR